MDYTALLIAAGIPSAVVAFCFWLLKKHIDKKEKKKETAEHKRQENEKLIVKAIGASLALSEATAAAVQRIPDANCNGDMRGALEYARSVKHKHKDFLYETALESLVE